MNRSAALRLAPADKLACHPQFSDYMAGKHVYPINVEISPSGICNASCAWCFYANTGELGSHRHVFLDTRVAYTLLAECQEMGVKSISWTGGGEPSLHHSIKSLVDWTSNKYGMEQGMFTNALTMPVYEPGLLSWVRVTMTDRPFKRDCIRALRPAKTVGIAFNYSGSQDDEYLKRTLNLACDVNADYVQVRPALKFHGKTVDIQPPAFEHPLMHVTDYKFEQARVPHGYDRCEAYHFSPMVWEDGNVDVCAYMRKHTGYTLGNLHKDSFRTILDRAPASVPVHKNCQICCRLHESNRMIYRARALEDRNFP